MCATRRGCREANTAADALSNVAMDGDGWEGLRDPQAQPQRSSAWVACCTPTAFAAPASMLDQWLLLHAGSHLAGWKAGRIFGPH